MRRLLALTSPLLTVFLGLAAHAAFPNASCDPNLSSCEPAGVEAYMRSIRWVDAKGRECDGLDLSYANTGGGSFDEPLQVTGEVGGARVPCTPSFLRGAELRGILTLVIDEDAADDADACATDRTVALTAILEIKAKGKRLVVAESLAGCGHLEIAPWDGEFLTPPLAENAVFDANPFNSLVSPKLKFEQEVRSFAAALHMPSDNPIVIGDEFGDVSRLDEPANPVAPECEDESGSSAGCGPGEVDASEGNTRASIARYHIRIRFAEAAD